MILRVTEYGEEVLRQTGDRIEVFDHGLRELAADMIETMYHAEGIGLAAHQVDFPIQMCVVDVSDLEDELLIYELDGKRPPIDLIMPMVLVNPVLRAIPGKSVAEEEGCLSFPGIRGAVTRADRIEVDYQDLGGAAHHLVAEGWVSRVVQHEVDHLNGVLFIDHMEPRALRMIESKIKKLKRATRDRMNEPSRES